MLHIGDTAPEFMLPDKDEQQVALRSYTQDRVVIFFYPKDNTPGCALETKGFNELAQEFQKNNIGVIGISGGDAASKTSFCEKVGKEVKLLSDTNFSVCEKYGVYGEKKFMGRTYMGINRITFIIDKDRKVIKVYDEVKPAVHPKEVLNYLVK
ncbi:MAG: thioredoxin-dependent thiol peroxidase [Nanoarchaeota archaeon]|nr:thioredoxin-dependent thiol peroxidase [Nanoarchaeota archaeon]